MNWMQSHITTEDIVRASQQRMRDAGWAEYRYAQRKAKFQRFLRWMRGNGAIWALFVFFSAVALIEIAYRSKP